jgi:hypothetical protein
MQLRKGGRPRKVRYCEWCGDELAYRVVPKRLCDKEACQRDWWVDYHRRKADICERKRQERLAAGNVKLCPQCNAPVWDKDHIYCKDACRRTAVRERSEALRSEIKKLVGLPTRIIKQRLQIGAPAVRYRIKAANCALAYAGSNKPKPELRARVLYLAAKGLSYGEIAKQLDVSRNTVTGHIWRERRLRAKAVLQQRAA